MTTIGIITSIMEVSVIVITTGRAGVTSAVVILIVGVGVVRAQWCARWDLTIIAWIIRSKVVVFEVMRVSSSAYGILAIVIIITGTWLVGAAIGVLVILSSVCGDYWCAIILIIAAIIVWSGTSQA